VGRPRFRRRLGVPGGLTTEPGTNGRCSAARAAGERPDGPPRIAGCEGRLHPPSCAFSFRPPRRPFRPAPLPHGQAACSGRRCSPRASSRRRAVPAEPVESPRSSASRRGGWRPCSGTTSPRVAPSRLSLEPRARAPLAGVGGRHVRGRARALAEASAGTWPEEPTTPSGPRRGLLRLQRHRGERPGSQAERSICRALVVDLDVHQKRHRRGVRRRPEVFTFSMPASTTSRSAAALRLDIGLPTGRRRRLPDAREAPAARAGGLPA
jgi:hypothetical protein